ncbi:MAG: 16S rRNA (guanine(966)-N(2))-methyltransferase RsmD [Iodobacter sp.]|jgi:16S rRNA (guanine966-N2)-methyltransferase
MAAQLKNQVRIIGGDYKRRLLKFPDAEGLRPTPDRVRETLFNWLGQECTGLVCLDLFSGSGALGFEAASRNAKRVVMIERAKNVAASLKSNQTLLGADNIEVIWGDALRFLDSTAERFDVVFLDPPFDSDLLAQVLPKLARVLNPDAVIYAETANWPERDGWDIVKEGKAGLVKYALLKQHAVSSC